MKLHKLIFPFLVTFLIILTGCNESFLDQEPKTGETEELFYNTFERVDMAVASAYSRLVFNGYDQATLINHSAMADDSDVGGSDPSDGATFKLIAQFTHDDGNERFMDLWRVNYKGIRLANTALRYLPNFAADKPQLVKERIAEMKFLRAYYHFEIMKFFGAAPIVDRVLDPKDFKTPRSPIADVLHFIQKDLIEAYPDLLLRGQQGDEYGHASKGAAQALLARAYLYESSYAKYWPSDERFAGCEQKFDKALAQAEQVISSSAYELVGINGERFDSWWGKAADGVTNKSYDGKINAFRWLFSVQGDNSKESVFEVQNVFDARGWPASRGNGITIMTTCRFTPLNPDAYYGWGFNNPSFYLLDAFANKDTRAAGTLSPENTEVINPKSDPRYYTTVGNVGDPFLFKTGNLAKGNLIWTTMNPSNVPTRTACRKWEIHPDEFLLNAAKGSSQGSPLNWKLIRYADVVLMAAEAAIESGDESKALTYVNMVRKRARMSSEDPNPANKIYPKDLASVQFGDIVHERRIEFALENYRFFDLVRWNLADKYINGSETAAMPGIQIRFIKGKHEFLPIPIDQIQRSDGTLIQYEPWR